MCRGRGAGLQPANLRESRQVTNLPHELRADGTRRVPATGSGQARGRCADFLPGVTIRPCLIITVIRGPALPSVGFFNRNRKLPVSRALCRAGKPDLLGPGVAGESLGAISEGATGPFGVALVGRGWLADAAVGEDLGGGAEIFEGSVSGNGTVEIQRDPRPGPEIRKTEIRCDPVPAFRVLSA